MKFAQQNGDVELTVVSDEEDKAIIVASAAHVLGYETKLARLQNTSDTIDNKRIGNLLK